MRFTQEWNLMSRNWADWRQVREGDFSLYLFKPLWFSHDKILIFIKNYIRHFHLEMTTTQFHWLQQISSVFTSKIGDSISVVSLISLFFLEFWEYWIYVSTNSLYKPMRTELLYCKGLYNLNLLIFSEGREIYCYKNTYLYDR